MKFSNGYFSFVSIREQQRVRNTIGECIQIGKKTFSIQQFNFRNEAIFDDCENICK